MILEENNNKKDKSRTDKTSTANVDSLTFNDLNNTINGNSNSTIYLSNNYKYNDASDNNFKNGISITRDLTVYGNGVTIDGNKIAGIFFVPYNQFNVIFYNINFINGNATHGGALHYADAYYCNFTGNTATEGGAIYGGDAYNCTFTNNTADNGGAIYITNAFNCTFKNNNDTAGHAIYKGSCILCRFNGDTTYMTTIIPAIINTLNYTSTYGSGKKLEFNLTINDKLYDGFNTTIELYQDGSLVKTVYGLTGKGWIVDLNAGTYAAVLRLTDYPDEKPSNATIIVSKKIPSVVIAPIGYVMLGQEVTIKYTTNSNGTVTIKVNGQPITDGKFTPNTAGIYNVTVEVAENDYYTGALNKTTFKAVGKLPTKITVNPITTSYYISKMLIITLKDANGKPITNELVTVNLDSAKKYKTNSKGQVKIQVGALTPKTYNAKITYAGSDLYNGSTASVKVTVKKSTPKITANAVKYKGKTKQFKAYFLTGHMKNHALKNAQVTLKVNGKTYSVKTNSKGQGIFNINKLKKGKYSAVLSIPSTNYYNEVTKNVIITVKK